MRESQSESQSAGLGRERYCARCGDLLSLKPDAEQFELGQTTRVTRDCHHCYCCQFRSLANFEKYNATTETGLSRWLRRTVQLPLTVFIACIAILLYVQFSLKLQDLSDLGYLDLFSSLACLIVFAPCLLLLLFHASRIALLRLIYSCLPANVLKRRLFIDYAVPQSWHEDFVFPVILQVKPVSCGLWPSRRVLRFALLKVGDHAIEFCWSSKDRIVLQRTMVATVKTDQSYLSSFLPEQSITLSELKDFQAISHSMLVFNRFSGEGQGVSRTAYRKIDKVLRGRLNVKEKRKILAEIN